jgi:hypothetical protein
METSERSESDSFDVLELGLPDFIDRSHVVLTSSLVEQFREDADRLDVSFETAVTDAVLLEHARDCISDASECLGVERAELLDEAIECVDSVSSRDATVVEGFIESVRDGDF